MVDALALMFAPAPETYFIFLIRAPEAGVARGLMIRAGNRHRRLRILQAVRTAVEQYAVISLRRLDAGQLVRRKTARMPPLGRERASAHRSSDFPHEPGGASPRRATVEHGGARQNPIFHKLSVKCHAAIAANASTPFTRRSHCRQYSLPAYTCFR
jgi:hypothetical protein